MTDLMRRSDDPNRRVKIQDLLQSIVEPPDHQEAFRQALAAIVTSERGGYITWEQAEILLKHVIGAMVERTVTDMVMETVGDALGAKSK